MNHYNPTFKCDIRTLLRYSAGEGDDVLYQDILRMLKLARDGVEINELVGDEVMEKMARHAREVEALNPEYCYS